jgi:hypothetical protein
MPNGHTFEVLGNTTPEQSKEVAKDYTRISALHCAFLAWAVQRILVLTFGWAVRWIYRGFRRSGT